jgi:hypothetical protein
VVRDTSPDAFTPTLGFAANIVSVTVLLFFAFIAIIFWLTSLAGRKNWEVAPQGVQRVATHPAEERAR